MLMLAGMMGLLMVGASAFIGLPEELDDLDDDTGDGPQTDLGLMDGDLFVGSGGAESCDGTRGGDQIGGYSGDDTLSGGAGTDLLRGNKGADQVFGGAGADTIHAGYDDDLAYGGSGDDSLYGGMGADILAGRGGSDVIVGGAGSDTLIGNAGADALIGGMSGDVLSGGSGDDTVFGGSGDDWLAGFAARLIAGEGEPQDDGRDYLNGGSGDDTVVGTPGDILTLGEGADTAVVIGAEEEDISAASILDFLAGEDQLVLLYSDDAGADQDIRIDEGQDATRVMMDGAVVAVLPARTQIEPDDIALVPESAAGRFLYPS